MLIAKHYKGKHDQSNHGHSAHHRSQYATIESVTSDHLADWESLPNTDYKRMQTEFLKDAMTGSLPIIGIQKGGKLKAFATYRYDAKDKANKTIYIPQLSAPPPKEKRCSQSPHKPIKGRKHKGDGRTTPFGRRVGNKRQRRT